MSDQAFTVVFNGNLRKLDGNPHKYETPFGSVLAIGIGNALADVETCPICAEPFKAKDICASDITEGTCHAACLEGSAVVDIDTGDEMPTGKIATYPYSDVMDPTPSSSSEGIKPCILCGQATCDVCQDIDGTASSEGDRALPSRDDVRRALETIKRANGADLDEWTHGVLPSYEIQEALVAIKISKEKYDAR